MKDDFQKAIKKAELYAEQAVVVTLDFSDATVTQTVGWAGHESYVDQKEYKAEEVKKEFLEYIAENDIPHVVVSDTNNSLIIALPREGGSEFSAQKASNVVENFFSGEKRIVLSMVSYVQRKASLKNKLLSPFSSIRREVNHNLAKFKK